MARLDSFTFRVDDEEKRLIARLSDYLQRNQSDTIRLLIREAVRTIELDNGKPAGEDTGNADTSG